MLFSGREGGQTFELQLELFSSCLQQRPWRSYRLQGGDAPLTVSLFNYQHDIVTMLAVVSDQDAYVRLTLSGKQRLLSLDICRYHAGLEWDDHRSLVVIPNGAQRALPPARLAAIRLAAPGLPLVPLPERLSEGVATGIFDIPSAFYQDGPWLIFPDVASPVLFRPRLFHSAPAEDVLTAGPMQSLHEAAQQYHPVHAPHVMAGPIAAMAQDFGHSNWQYLADLLQQLAHLPLSTFQAWIALAADPKALAAAVFRLELDRAFCERIRGELAVIWECVPLPLWRSTHERFRAWLGCVGLAENYVAPVLLQRRAVFGALAPRFEDLSEYLDTGDLRCLPQAPIAFVLPVWYQTLRQAHSDNLDWPTQLGAALGAWIRRHRHALPPVVSNLSSAGFTDAVTYLPIFMAHVSTGQATLADLLQDNAVQKFALKQLTDFDRALWYDPVYALFVSYLLARPQA
ncbi:MAG: STY4851/ECs_5259 family protein [Burkholderiaceae bacterium]|nr:STY4851/ECs_5259 family protein [Burkholderiaceae bacterium]